MTSPPNKHLNQPHDRFESICMVAVKVVFGLVGVWVAAEVVALSLFTLVALLERLFAAVLEAIRAALDCQPGRSGSLLFRSSRPALCERGALTQ